MITDIVMPGGMSGFDLGREVARRYGDRGTKILYTSGYADVAARRDGEVPEDGVFLAKPYGMEALAHKIREILDG